MLSPKLYALVVPARQAYSHPASVGSRYTWPDAFFLGHLAEPLAELYGIVPGDVIDRVIVPYYAWFQGLDDLLVLEQHLTLKDARVLPHDAKVLVLGYLVDPHVEAFGDGDLVELLRWLGSWFT